MGGESIQAKGSASAGALAAGSGNHGSSAGKALVANAIGGKLRRHGSSALLEGQGLDLSQFRLNGFGTAPVTGTTTPSGDIFRSEDCEEPQVQNEVQLANVGRKRLSPEGGLQPDHGTVKKMRADSLGLLQLPSANGSVQHHVLPSPAGGGGSVFRADVDVRKGMFDLQHGTGGAGARPGALAGAAATASPAVPPQTQKLATELKDCPAEVLHIASIALARFGGGADQSKVADAVAFTAKEIFQLAQAKVNAASLLSVGAKAGVPARTSPSNFGYQFTGNGVLASPKPTAATARPPGSKLRHYPSSSLSLGSLSNLGDSIDGRQATTTADKVAALSSFLGSPQGPFGAPSLVGSISTQYLDDGGTELGKSGGLLFGGAGRSPRFSVPASQKDAIVGASEFSALSTPSFTTNTAAQGPAKETKATPDNIPHHDGVVPAENRVNSGIAHEMDTADANSAPADADTDRESGRKGLGERKGSSSTDLASDSSRRVGSGKSTSTSKSSNLTKAGNVKKCRHGERWTEEQDEALKQAVQIHDEKNWKKVAALVPGRNHVQCLQRWRKVLQPGLRKGAWTEEEDSMLKDIVLKSNQTPSWGIVADSIPGRTAKQCRERWRLNLNPDINREPWSPEEDALLLKLQEKVGSRWAEIKNHFDRRTENAVKTRFKSLKRAKAKEWTEEVDNKLVAVCRKFGKDWAAIANAMKPRTKNAVKARVRDLQHQGVQVFASPSRGSRRQHVTHESSKMGQHIGKIMFVNAAADCAFLFVPAMQEAAAKFFAPMIDANPGGPDTVMTKELVRVWSIFLFFHGVVRFVTAANISSPVARQFGMASYLMESLPVAWLCTNPSYETKEGLPMVILPLLPLYMLATYKDKSKKDD
ncbi:Transcription factor MYB3R-2 (Myb-related protein MYB3R-2) (OsMYB3R-2) [Durusdinium trenchii]|uniref:Transcription factor MYB3R-2 (Myb-related protein MYB3R-2) (OsMYB3R-2) n=1 Tax=Durusdinium trenchii TaxID=1381693 RepID=A0ABP0HRC4_9DINO